MRTHNEVTVDGNQLKNMNSRFPNAITGNNENRINTYSQYDDSDEYLTVAQLSFRYPAFSQGSIRWLIFNQDTNGFSKVVRKIGRKVVLSLKEWRSFLAEARTK